MTNEEYQRYIDLIINSNVKKWKVEVDLLRYEDETVFNKITGYVVNSSSTLTQTFKNGQRSNISFTIISPNQKFEIAPDSLWLRQKIGVKIGIESESGESFWFDKGVFVMEDPTTLTQGGSKTITINASDKFSLCDGSLGGEVDGNYTIPVDSVTCGQAINYILRPSNQIEREVFYDSKPPLISAELENVALPYTITAEVGEPISNVLEEIANMVSAHLYYNEYGTLVVEPNEYDHQKPNKLIMTQGDFNIKKINTTYYHSKVYNSVLVIGTTVNGDISTAVAENNDLTSEFSIPNLGFKRVKVIEDPAIYTDSLAEVRAEYELQKITRLQTSQTISSVPVPHLNVGDVILINDERMVINEISLPLNTASGMSMVCSPVHEVQYNIAREYTGTEEPL